MSAAVHAPAPAALPGAAAVRRARARDRRVYLESHPVMFALLAATRRAPVRRLGRAVLVHDRAAYVTALTRIPLDRTAEGTTGGAAGRLTGDGLLFDQHGEAHRRTRRSTADQLGSAGVTRLRSVWMEVLERRLAPLSHGAEIDLVPLAADLAGTTAAALLDLRTSLPNAPARPTGCPVHPTAGARSDRSQVLAPPPGLGWDLAEAAREAGAAAAHAHLPSLATLPGVDRVPGLAQWAARTRDRAERRAAAAAERLTALAAPEGGPSAGLSTMLAVAAITTTVAALPRAAAWAADTGMWDFAETHPQEFADELLRVTAPTPLLPRVAAAEATLDGCPVTAGDRLLLIARHAVAAHTDAPDPLHPAPPAVAQLVFGTGPHACPGARLARTQLADLLTALAPHRPMVVRARADRESALPSWRSLTVRATR